MASVGAGGSQSRGTTWWASQVRAPVVQSEPGCPAGAQHERERDPELPARYRAAVGMSLVPGKLRGELTACVHLCLPSDSMFGGLCSQLTPPLLCLKGWEKGVVFINGQNLGRYWNIGPQETLYLPGAWLDQGLNQVGALFLGPLLVPALPVSWCFSGGPWWAGEDGSSGQPLPSGPLLRLRDRLAVSPGHCLRGEDGGSGGTVHGNALPGPAPVHELSGPQASRRGGSRPSLLTAGRPAAAPSVPPLGSQALALPTAAVQTLPCRTGEASWGRGRAPP